jgi:hypothetical protein
MAEILKLDVREDDRAYALFIERRDMSAVQTLSSDGSDVIRAVSAEIQPAIEGIQRAVGAIAKKLQGLALPADTIELKFGLKASTKAGFFIASADGQAEIEIKMTWTKKA